MHKSVPDLNPKRILVLQQKKIGDVLLSTPAVRMLKSRFPDAEIHFFADTKCAEVLKHNPDIHRLWLLDKKEHSNWLKALLFYYRTARNSYDLVVDFQQLPRCRFIAAFSRARVRLSYPPPWYNRPWYTHWVRPLDGYAAMTKASILRALSLEWNMERPRIFLTDEERHFGREYARNSGTAADDILITVDPGHAFAVRRWPAEHFAGLIARALEQRPKLKFLLFFGPGEENTARQVQQLCGRPDRCLVPDRLLGLREMAAVIAAASLQFGNCSGPRHFAAALDVPSLTVLGATSSSWTFPSPEHRDIALSAECQPCNQNHCPHEHFCLKQLTPDMVLPLFLEMIDAYGRPFNG